MHGQGRLVDSKGKIYDGLFAFDKFYQGRIHTLSGYDVDYQPDFNITSASNSQINSEYIADLQDKVLENCTTSIQTILV